MSKYVPSDEVYERGALGVRERLRHPVMAGVEWSADTTAGVVIDYVSAMIAAEVREQIAREIEAERDRFVARFPDDPTGYEASICNRCASIARGDEQR